MTRAQQIAALRDDVLSLEILVDLYTDTEDRALAGTKRKLRAARAKLAEAEAKASRPTYTDQETLTLVQGCARIERDRIVALIRTRAADTYDPEINGNRDDRVIADALIELAGDLEALS